MFKALLNILFPKACSGCSRVLLESEDLVCTHCRHDMPFTQHYLDTQNETYKKFYGRLPVEHASSVVYFHKKGIVQELIHNLKYKGKKEIGALIGKWYVQDIKDIEVLQSVTEVVPVPLHKKKLRQRGYNQVAGFGKALADGLGAKYNDDLLLRTTYNKTQTKKNITARAEIISNSFDITPTDADKNKHFLLVDDVITTGATLEACGRALLKIPGARVSIVTIAYAHT
ncbi:ComF family protein [Flavobacterium cerinum]|uniref:ComF family protein n=1 Tax=Flavobacterium cerinum TaxID=2502784 RepID=A0A444H8K9_9FLAO|nr:ComF family protein [Flavobacterium cerinum]RWW99614.1 ComF family protein [Flavobacterium cerinum]